MRRKIFLSDIDFTDAEIREVVKVLKRKWLSQGETTRAFEERFCRYLKCKHAFAVSSCTTALHLALRVLGVKPGDEVIVPSLTFVATVNAVVYTGATPVFADAAGLDNFNISPDDIQRKITRRTKAVIVMHYGGYACDMDAVKSIAKRHGLFVVEDAAHGVGGTYKGKKLGTLGDAGCFSFFANKNLVTGEGGMIVTDEDALAEKIRLLRSHGMTTSSWDRYKGHSFSYDVLDIGYNYRFDEMRSAIGLVQLKKLEKNNRKRKMLVNRYRKNLKGLEACSVPFSDFTGTPAYHLFPVILHSIVNRAELMARLNESGLQTSIHYPPVHLFSFYRNRMKNVKLPVTEAIGKRVVTLPLHPLMKADDVDYITNTLKALLTETWN